MDRIILKQTLHAQAIPLADAVAKKLAYLQSDEVFTEDVEPLTALSVSKENDFASAFGAEIKTTVRAQPQTIAPCPQPQRPQTVVVQPAPTDATPDPKQNIRDRIAQLRGISNMPGSYLKKL